MIGRYMNNTVKRYIQKVTYEAIMNAKKTPESETDKEAKELYKKIEILWR